MLLSIVGIDVTPFGYYQAKVAQEEAVGPVVAVPRMRSAPMAAAEVGLVRRLLEHRHSRRRVVPLKIPGEAGRRMSSGALVATDPWITGTQVFDQWLEEQP